MLSKPVSNGTVFIVFDMEWNQPFPGKSYPFEVSTLSGEIIDIGAVKYVYENGNLKYIDEFFCDVKPEKYTKIHYHVKKVTHKTNADLRNGIPLKVAYSKFREFCGEEFILVGWGNSDPDMLKMNLKFFGMESNLQCYFLDVQPVFSLFSGEKGHQRSVEFAVDFYNIQKDDTFHSAVADARYTGEIFEKIFENNNSDEVLKVISTSALNPDLKREYTCVGSESDNTENALKLISGFCKVCPICDKIFTPKVVEFRIRKSCYGLYTCEEHGDFFYRARVKKNKTHKYYSAAVLRFATQTDYFLIENKKEEYDQYGQVGAPKIVNETISSQSVEEK